MLMYLLGEKRPPWAHPIFFVVCSGFGWLGGVALVVALLSGAHERGLVVALALCAVGLIFLGVDLLVVRSLRRTRVGWEPWKPPTLSRLVRSRW